MALRVKTNTTEGTERNLRPVKVDSGLGEPDILHEELQGYLDILLGRAKLPVGFQSTIDLMEAADAFYARGQEIKFQIHQLERQKIVRNGRGSQDPYYLFRTGELEDFLEACKQSVNTGSRRLSALQYELEKNIRGLNSLGG